jgi:hypothetical protein
MLRYPLNSSPEHYKLICGARWPKQINPAYPAVLCQPCGLRLQFYSIPSKVKPVSTLTFLPPLLEIGAVFL